MTVEALRVVKKPKREHSQEDNDASAQKLKPTLLSRVEKKIKALNKKISGIEILRDRLKNGETLDDAQLAKIATQATLVEELDDFISGRKT